MNRTTLSLSELSGLPVPSDIECHGRCFSKVLAEKPFP